LFFLFSCSAFFSGSETALFSLNPIRIQHLEKEGSHSASLVRHLLDHPSKLLVTILIGNETVNILASSTAASFCVRFLGEETGPIVATVAMTLLLLVFGEVTPKAFAVQAPQKYAFFACRPLLFFSKVIFPIRIVLTGIADGILRLFGGERKSHERLLTGQEFRTLLDVSEREGVVETAERKMIDNLFDFSEMSVKEIMIPRTDMFCFSLSDTFEEILPNAAPNSMPGFRSMQEPSIISSELCMSKICCHSFMEHIRISIYNMCCEKPFYSRNQKGSGTSQGFSTKKNPYCDCG
jgi:putative hemolysin